ncbi:hypothetical protein GQ42DRAFT_177415 [Ramicandelaber brevisporus]|nr:hypothetical protein GQ42DRAFT_177415 [Ramicandelaber brevisporus]
MMLRLAYVTLLAVVLTAGNVGAIGTNMPPCQGTDAPGYIMVCDQPKSRTSSASSNCEPISSLEHCNSISTDGFVNHGFPPLVAISSPSKASAVTTEPKVSGAPVTIRAGGHYQCTVFSSLGCSGKNTTVTNTGGSEFSFKPKSFNCPCIPFPVKL